MGFSKYVKIKYGYKSIEDRKAKWKHTVVKISPYT